MFALCCYCSITLQGLFIGWLAASSLHRTSGASARFARSWLIGCAGRLGGRLQAYGRSLDGGQAVATRITLGSSCCSPNHDGSRILLPCGNFVGERETCPLHMKHRDRNTYAIMARVLLTRVLATPTPDAHIRHTQDAVVRRPLRPCVPYRVPRSPFGACASWGLVLL